MKTTLDKLLQWPAKLDSIGNSVEPVLVPCPTASEHLSCTLYLPISNAYFLHLQKNNIKNKKIQLLLENR